MASRRTVQLPNTTKIWTILAVLLFSCGITAAQHTKRDLSFSFAKNGQLSLIKNNTYRYYSSPVIWSLKYQIYTTYILSASVALEHVSQTNEREGIWHPLGDPADPVAGYNANIAERLSMTTLYIEVAKTVLRTDDFRIAVGGDIGYGLGTPVASVEKIIGHTTTNYESESIWSSYILGAFIRARLTIYAEDDLDIGLTGTVRYWSLPTIGPLADGKKAGGYFGPNISGLHELGYLLGISIGLN